MREDPRHLLDSTDALVANDPADMLGLVEGAAGQWRQAVEEVDSFSAPRSWRGKRRVVLAGMGGSAIAGDLAATYLSRRWPVSLSVIRDYTLPAWVDEETLFLALSYSGNTEETLSAWKEAGKRGLERAVITTGGTLGVEAGKAGVPHLTLPAGYPPRAALPSCLVTLLKLLSGVGAESESSPGGDKTSSEMEEAAEVLEGLRDEYGREKEVIENPAKELALWLGTAWTVIYAPDYPLGPVALRWRGQIGENGKRVASGHMLPEMNHNEIVGWEVQGELYPVTRVLLLEDSDQGSRLDLRIDTTAVLLERAGAPLRRLSTRGEGLLARMISLVALGDYTSVYLAVGWKVDPTPVKKIDYLKSKLAEATT